MPIDASKKVESITYNGTPMSLAFNAIKTSGAFTNTATVSSVQVEGIAAALQDVNSSMILVVDASALEQGTTRTGLSYYSLNLSDTSYLVFTVISFDQSTVSATMAGYFVIKITNKTESSYEIGVAKIVMNNQDITAYAPNLPCNLIVYTPANISTGE